MNDFEILLQAANIIFNDSLFFAHENKQSMSGMALELAKDIIDFYNFRTSLKQSEIINEKNINSSIITTNSMRKH